MANTDKINCPCIKCGIFRPKLKPRYLPWEVCKAKWAEDLKFYNMHLERIHNASCSLDNTPPALNVNYYLQKRKCFTDYNRAYEIDKENKILLRKITAIDRKGGDIKTVNPLAYFSVSRWRRHLDQMRVIERENRRVHDVICNSRSHYAKRTMTDEWKKFLVRMVLSSKFPVSIFKKTSADRALRRAASISEHLNIKKISRPQCFLDFQVLEGEYLGRIVVELYSDIVPITVKNFTSICQPYGNLTYKNCPVHRIVKGRFLETGDITLGTGMGGCSFFGKEFDEENHVLKHTKAGVLSMVRVGKQKNNSRFCITFASMQEWDKKNVVFGKVVYGAAVLEKINGYGRKIGKPLSPIVIADCGEMPPCNCHQRDIKCAY